MPRSRVLAHDDELHVRIGGRPQDSRRTHLPSVPRSRSPQAGTHAIVKVGYFRAGRVPGYLAYIERDGTAGPGGRDGTTAVQGYSGYIAREGAGDDGQRAELFTRYGETVDREAFVTRSHADPRAWTIIISPECQDLDMARYVREFMLQMELDLDRRLDWIAATHRNTDVTHSHILLRGSDRAGQAFRMPKRYISHGLRARAMEIATRAQELGWVRTTPPREALVPSLSHDVSQVVRWHLLAARWIVAHAREAYQR